MAVLNLVTSYPQWKFMHFFVRQTDKKFFLSNQTTLPLLL